MRYAEVRAILKALKTSYVEQGYAATNRRFEELAAEYAMTPQWRMSIRTKFAAQVMREQLTCPAGLELQPHEANPLGITRPPKNVTRLSST